MATRTLIVNAKLATMAGEGLGEIRDGALAIEGERLAWVGPRADLPSEWTSVDAIDAGGGWITPGLIDCHTHLVFAGNRAEEFRLRAEGASYEEIAKGGGGIVSTVRATRAAGEAELLRQSEARLKALMAEGVTTVEIKSGYGLDLASERSMLRVARQLGERHPVGVRTTFLGMHALPPEYSGRQGDYARVVADEWLPVLAAEGLVDSVDAFCEKIGFTPDETRYLFAAAKRLGLPVKLHAEQLSNQHGSALAASYGALSADHLEWLDEGGIAAMAEAGTVAVLLPAAYYVLRETKLPPVEALRAAGVPMAVASDLNPGTAPVVSLLAAMHMAATLFRLTPTEVLRGATVHAAKALGLSGECGQLQAGQRADLCLWRVDSPAELCYWLGGLRPERVWWGGVER